MGDVRLVMFRANGEQRNFPLNPDRTLVGRKNDCDVRIPVDEVSRHHTEFVIEGKDVVVRDLGSSNGTFVNNKRVKTAKLSPGDHVIIGPVVFTVQVDGEPQDIRPVKTKLKRQAPAVMPEPAGAEADLDASDELDPISALEALASSADQTAIDPFDDEDL